MRDGTIQGPRGAGFGYASGTVIGDGHRKYKGRRIIDVGCWMGSDMLGLVCAVDIVFVVLPLLVSLFRDIWIVGVLELRSVRWLNARWFDCGGYKGDVVGSGQLVALQSTLDDS